MTTGYRCLQVRPLDSSVGLLRPACVLPDQVTPDHDALDVMTDFRRMTAFVAMPWDTVKQAEGRMLRRKIRLLFVIDEQDRMVGLITSTDIQGEKPMQVMQRRGLRHDDLVVADIMTPAAQLEAVQLRDIQGAKAGHVLATLQASGRQHALVVETVAGRPMIRGLLSMSQLSRQLRIEAPADSEVAHSFADIQARLTHA
jgi:CBS-domain-containing membrane protein